jgi:hypothetical protein
MGFPVFVLDWSRGYCKTNCSYILWKMKFQVKKATDLKEPRIDGSKENNADNDLYHPMLVTF